MTSVSLIAPAWQANWAPLLTLLGVGAVLAAAPLLWLWRRYDQPQQQERARVRALAWLILALTFDLVLVGAFTRLTDSGLGCPDWPGCYGHASPIGAAESIAHAQSAMPTGPVTFSKAWIEMLHRYLASAVGALLVLQAALRLRRWWRDADARFPWLPVLLVAWVIGQGVFGWLTVTMRLFPLIVTGHLLGAYGLLALQTWLLARESAAERPAPVGQARIPTGLRWATWLGLLLLLVQAGSGAWVSSNYAVLACMDFPGCTGLDWQGEHWQQAWLAWRELGLMANGEYVPLPVLMAIHMTHRLLALLTVSVLLLLALWWWRATRAARVTHTHSATPRHEAVWVAKVLAAVLVLQAFTGIGNVVLQWPMLGALLHTGGAGALVVLLVWAGRRWLSDAPSQSAFWVVWRQFHALTKPRVIQLIVFCAVIGMVLAVPGWPSWAQWQTVIAASIGIYAVAGAAAALNCLIEKNIDAQMRRTAWRPTARGELSDLQTLLFALGLCALGCAILWWWVNALTMWLTLATFVGYAIVYTVGLKPLTPQNIVIGGASGAMPPVLGWAAMANTLSPEAWLLSLIIFVWTPPHFWALALYRVEDYRKSGLPMLPVTHGSDFTRLQILLYTGMLTAVCVLPFAYGMSSWLYLVVALVVCAGFAAYAWRLWRAYSEPLARATFRFSLVHLSVLFAALLLDHYLL